MTPMARGFFVTGTDTGVGKTEITCGLMRAFASGGQTVIGMKPVAAGARHVHGVLRNTDVEKLLSASNVLVEREQMNPYLFAPGIAPHLAAERTGARIEIPIIVSAYRRLRARADVVLVEGVGGFLVPLTAHSDTGELSRLLGLPVILVVGMRLGCISHALLTAGAIRGRGLVLAGWFANRIDPAMRAYRGNVRALETRLNAPLLGEITFCSGAKLRRAEIDRVMRTSGIVERLARSARCRKRGGNTI